jgi:hypothetical protein
VGTGIIYAAIVVAWAAYLLPLVRHHREQPSATRDARATGAMRVLGKRSSGARVRGSDTGGAAVAAPVDPTEPDVPAAVEVSRPRYDAAARRRRVLFLILATTVVMAVFAYVGTLAWWTLAIPAGLLAGFVVLARRSVRAARSARRRAGSRPALVSQRADRPVAAVATAPTTATTTSAATTVTRKSSTTPAVPDIADPAAAWVAHSPVDAWDPLPITLPTYVTKDVAPARRVRTIDLSGATAYSAGRLPEAELLSRQPASVDELSTDRRGADGDGTAHAATG